MFTFISYISNPPKTILKTPHHKHFSHPRNGLFSLINVESPGKSMLTAHTYAYTYQHRTQKFTYPHTHTRTQTGMRDISPVKRSTYQALSVLHAHLICYCPITLSSVLPAAGSRLRLTHSLSLYAHTFALFREAFLLVEIQYDLFINIHQI